MSAGRRTALLLPTLLLTTIVTAVISSLGAPLVPLVADDLGVALSDAQWSLTAALLVGAVSAPVLGRLGDGPHRREALARGLGLVALGCVVAAVAGSLGVLVAGRALQGLGLGLIPLAMAVARHGLPTARITPAIALLSVSAAAGIGVGYPVSGLVAERFGLAGAYWFGAAFAGVALALVLAVVPSSRGERAPALDGRGALVLAGALVALLLAIGQGESWGWTSATVLALAAAAALLLALWVPLQLRTAAPLVELRLLRHPAVLTANGCALVLGAALYIDLSIVTAFVQAPSAGGYGFDATVLAAGLCLVPFSVMSVVASRLLPALGARIGQAGILPLGCLICGLAGVVFALGHSALWEVFVLMGIVGIGMGLTFAAIPGMIVAAVPQEETGSAMGFYQVVRYVGFSVGSAATAAVLAAHTPSGARLPTVTGFETAAWASVALCVAAALAARVLPRRARGARPDGQAGTADPRRARPETGAARLVGPRG
ncbi:MFS transporter [Paraconexibacter algicola]|uniref:MFS transporter n=1 Tax=Paraconexibacter algicola TaxID=2133960 RepID=A0A2T4UG99_9ACTN|nr:MFS transporter [Paraconexibacter algicola]PTL58274.1 MFS transporter [Paraconexibacter algicola]